MTSPFLGRARTAPRISLRRLGGSLLAFLTTLDRAYRHRIALSELDDRMLRDIGITRADVADELRRPLFEAFGPPRSL